MGVRSSTASPVSVHSSSTPSTVPAATVDSDVNTTGSGTAPGAIVDVDGAAWRDFQGSGRPEARIQGLSTSAMTSTGLIDVQWDKPGDAVTFELAVEVTGDPSKVRAELWTNANHNAEPARYDALPMTLARVDGRTAVYRIELPIEKLGNYRATARLSVDDGRSFQWAGEQGIPDLRFRPRDESHDAMKMVEVNVGNVNFDSSTGRLGTFADMMEPGTPETTGKYTLEWLAEQGKTDIWLQPPFEVSTINRHPDDDSGSPYAVKDFFSVRTEYSRAGRDLQGEDARNAASAEFKAFVARAHSLGIQVHLDVALNHVGHNYDFRDLFVRYDNAGREIREVRKDDYANLAVGDQLEVIKRRLADPNLPRYMEYVAPWMYGSRFGNAHGAQSVDEKAAGGWGQWYDTAQLNHGGHFGEEPHPESQEAAAVRGWLTRVLQYWSVDMDVDGFRLDHLTGLPTRFLEEAFNLAQADVDRHQPGKRLFVMGEDFHNVDNTRHYLDAIQGGWFHNFIRAQTPADLEHIVQDPNFKRNLLNLSSHDEERFINAFGENYRAATRLGCLLHLFGGPSMEVAGDEFGERQKMLFKQLRGLPALRSIDSVKKEIATAYRRASKATRTLPALQDDNRVFLQPRTGGPDPHLLAVSRNVDANKPGQAVLVVANLHNDRTRENAFKLDDETRRRIDPDRRYQVRDLMADDPHASLWDPPLLGRELLEGGLFCRLRPYQIQVLDLQPVD
ncbi:MAG: alpha-amylase family glycosyl hydrolase [Pseudomonadota bacterium]